MAASTDTLAPPSADENPLVRLREGFARLNNTQKIGLLAALLAILAIAITTLLWSQRPEWKVLFSNLSERDGGAIVASLEQQNIPHKMSPNGAIMVTSDRVHEVRLKLASQGLPRGGMVGFELMENQKFGISQFAEQVNYQRGLEGELGRTIGSIAAVQSARVHLAIPKPSVFIREEQKPTASVMLNLYPGRGLDPSQISGIIHLVSSSVPHMNSNSVTLIDQSGNLLPLPKSKLQEAGLDPSQIKYVREIEEGIIKRIENILTPVFGADNFKVQVAADIDFSHSEQTAETYRPNATTENSVMRSQQTSESVNAPQTTGGVPGALTNQPPVPATAPLTQPDVAGTAPRANSRPGEPTGKLESAGVTAALNTLNPPISSTKNATINYEVDKTIRYTKQALGNIRRLTAAVVVNHRKDVDKAGKPITKPLPDTEIKQINELVREAMGYNPARGDSISVANAPFAAIEKTDDSQPLWKDPENISFAKEMIKYLVIAGIVLLMYLKMIQPALRTMFPPPPEPEPAPDSIEGVADAAGHVAITGLPGEEGSIGGADGEDQVTIDHYAVKIQKARDFAQHDPKAVANIIKEWIEANG